MQRHVVNLNYQHFLQPLNWWLDRIYFCLPGNMSHESLEVKISFIVQLMTMEGIYFQECEGTNFSSLRWEKKLRGNFFQNLRGGTKSSWKCNEAALKLLSNAISYLDTCFCNSRSTSLSQNRNLPTPNFIKVTSVMASTFSILFCA